LTSRNQSINHQFHRLSVARFSNPRMRWATCAVTELGFIRLSSNPATGLGSKTPAEAASLLRTMTRDKGHRYFEALPSPAAGGQWNVLLGRRQVTDAYLLEIAKRNRAVRLTFDARLRALDSDHVEVLSPRI
jgi:predicted nucleic acid-binding protein